MNIGRCIFLVDRLKFGNRLICLGNFDTILSRCGAVVAREAHNLEVSGSNPLTATKLLTRILQIDWHG